jgi:hypothetical protein
MRQIVLAMDPDGVVRLERDPEYDAPGAALAAAGI